MGKAEVVIALFADSHSAGAAVNERRVAGFTHPSAFGKECLSGLPLAGTVLAFDQDREIYGEGDEADVIFKVLSGLVRTCTFLRDGRRQIDAFHAPGDLFGLGIGAKHSLSAEAVRDSTVILYRRRGIEALAVKSKRLSHQLFAYAIWSMTRAQEHSVLLGRRSAVEKVAAFLIDWATYSSEGDVITLEMPRQDIADYLGLTTETVSRTLSHLERKALIERGTARQIRLMDPDGLRDLNS